MTTLAASPTDFPAGVWLDLVRQGGVVAGVCIVLVAILVLGRFIALPLADRWLETAKTLDKLGHSLKEAIEDHVKLAETNRQTSQRLESVLDRMRESHSAPSRVDRGRERR